jgi:hypothetical protein
MTEKMAAAPRFGRVRLTAYTDVIEEDKEGRHTQWSALTLVLDDGTLYISFRGTDDTLFGWKEDFDMAVVDTIPAQKQAAEYVRRVMLAYPKSKVRIGGHSKGGNLALYAAAKCGRDLQERILMVYANDSPGFSKVFLAEEDYLAIKDRVRLLLPDQSFVGLLFYHDAKRTVIKSDEKSVRQHDSFSWQVEQNHFVTVPAIAGEALLLRKAVEAWMNDMTVEERKAFVEAFYRILTGFEAKTLTELMENRAVLLHSYRKLDAEQRRIIREMLRRLLSNGKEVYSAAISKGGKQIKEQEKEQKREQRKEPMSKTKKGFVTALDGASIGVPSGKKRKSIVK